MEENPTRLFMPSHWTGETDSSEVELSKRDRSNAPAPYCLFRGGRKLLWNHSTFIAFHNPIRILQDWNRKRKSSWKMLGASSPHIHPKLELATRSAGFQILCSASMIGTSRTATWERDFEAFDAPGWLNQWSSIGGFVTRGYCSLLPPLIHSGSGFEPLKDFESFALTTQTRICSPGNLCLFRALQ